MLRSVDEAETGAIVHLYPHTKTASRTCYAMQVVKIIEGKKHWPMVVVGWKEGGVDKWELVHKDNIRVRPPTKAREDKKQGDSMQDVSKTKVARVRVMPRRGKPIELADNEEQGTLF